MKRFVLVGLSACWAREQPPGAPISNAVAVAPSETRAMTVAWSTPEVSNGCFYFSGPFDLGRDQHLGAMASVRTARPSVEVDFGAGAGTPFKGTLRGDQLVLNRRQEFQFDGASWSVSEEMVGTFDGRTMRLRYGYAECNLAAKDSCPGSCAIHAGLTLVSR